MFNLADIEHGYAYRRANPDPQLSVFPLLLSLLSLFLACFSFPNILSSLLLLLSSLFLVFSLLSSSLTFFVMQGAILTRSGCVLMIVIISSLTGNTLVPHVSARVSYIMPVRISLSLSVRLHVHVHVHDWFGGIQLDQYVLY